MAGSTYVLDKPVSVLSTYNSSAAAGVTQYRCVKITTAGKLDLQTASTAGNIAFVVQDNIDATKVATGNAVADVRFMGITKVFVTTASGITVGSRVMPGTAGGVIAATGATAQVLGICVGSNASFGTIGDGDIIDVLLTPGTQFGA